MKFLTFIFAVSICATSFAGDKAAEHREWLKQAMAKEVSRAKDAVDHHGNIERFEKKFGWAKESQPHKYKAMMDANKQALHAWDDVGKKARTARTPEDLNNLKNKASDAAGRAYLAEVALKFAGGADNRKAMLKKASSTELKIIVDNLNKNEADLFKVRQQHHNTAMQLKDLEQENRLLNDALKHAYEKARRK